MQPGIPFLASHFLCPASRTQTHLSNGSFLDPVAASCSPPLLCPRGGRKHQLLSSSTHCLSGRLTQARGLQAHLRASAEEAERYPSPAVPNPETQNPTSFPQVPTGYRTLMCSQLCEYGSVLMLLRPKV